ncbi:DegT/DnrJ/EryC1/StrS family aminotransferase [Sinimarinibacterium thermocellulolyticum]|uniref:DegT/DnrJ/EryC1/StrS family aminotransferase n=1 Tax=Sinimarinibacterium thermocellulolyticum TaxID=3170016 RepID=A0ABV2A5G4_9GAMM
MLDRTDFIPFAAPSIGEEEVAAATAVMRSGWLTTGPKAREFEAAFAAYLGGGEAIAVNSATAGLHLGLESLGVGPGDAVVTTVYTFTATAEVIRYLGADPVFVDIDPDTLNISVQGLRDALSRRRVKAIIPVHFGGQACEMDEIVELARSHGAAIMSDAAHALPTTYRGRLVGALDDDISVFSFYANKTLCTGEGGMVVTRNKALAERMRIMRLHGISRDVFDRFRSTKPAWYYEVVAPGFKYNMGDIAAAIGIEQLRKLEDMRRARQSIAERYLAALRALPLKLPIVARTDDLHAWHLFVIQLDLDRLRIDRDRFIESMSAAGIGTSVHYIPLHLHPYWRDTYALRAEQFPVASAVYPRVVSLPIYPGMSDVAVGRVIDAVRQILLDASR